MKTAFSYYSDMVSIIEKSEEKDHIRLLITKGKDKTLYMNIDAKTFSEIKKSLIKQEERQAQALQEAIDAV